MCCALHQLHAQNAANTFTSATYIGGYHIKCNGQSTGSIKANPSFGTAPYTFLWSSGETTPQINNKPAGIYIVTMTDSLNSTNVDTFELKQPYPLDYEATLSNYFGYHIDTHGGHRGTIQLAAKGGTPPYRYLWNNGDSSVNRTGLTAGTYTFTITDANQCSTNGSITLTEPNPISISFSGVENPKCFKGDDGKATINITGGLGDFSVVWDNGSFSLSPEDLISGFNAVRIYEHGKAVLDTGITLTSVDAIDIQFTYTDYNGFNVSCVDCFNGSITTTTTGGTAPYTYLWDDVSNSTTANLSNLNGGEYNLMVNDANGCKTGNSAQLTMPTPKDWSRHGNANIDTSEFIGSTDTSAVVFKTNGQEAMRLMGNGNVGVGVNNPSEKLEVNGIIKAHGLKLDNIAFKFEPVNSVNPEIISWGSDLIPTPPGGVFLPAFPVPCIGPLNIERANLFNGGAVFKVKQAIQNSVACKNNDPTMYVGLFGCDGAIEVNQKDNSNGSQSFFAANKLLINTLCGNDVIVGNTTSGNLIANYRIGIGISTPQYKLDVAGAVNATSFLRDGVEIRGSLWSEATNSADNICYNSGNVGIGTCNPDYLLHLKGTSTAIMLENTDASGNNIPNKFILSSANGVSRLISDHGFTFFIDSDNNEDINSNPYTEYFRVAKNASSYDNNIKDLFFINGEGTGYIRELYVQEPLSNNGKSYPDYVFDDKYNLMSLADFSNFIKKEKHLPNIPTAIDFKKENKGLAVSDMLLKLLRTQEEQALYIVQLHEQNELLKKQVELLLKK